MSTKVSFFKRTIGLKKQVQIYGKEMPHSQITEQIMAP